MSKKSNVISDKNFELIQKEKPKKETLALPGTPQKKSQHAARAEENTKRLSNRILNLVRDNRRQSRRNSFISKGYASDRMASEDDTDSQSSCDSPLLKGGSPNNIKASR